MTYEELVGLARRLEGRKLETVTGRRFTVGVSRHGEVFFTPESSGYGQSDGRKAAERFLERCNASGSLRPGDYAGVSHNASYLIGMIIASGRLSFRPMTTPPLTDGRLAVALISEVFWEPDGDVRLRQRLAEAADRGADLAVLPELPLNPWRPATKEPRDEDAEPMDGPRATLQGEAAAEAGIGLIGGIIHRAEDGRRTSRALVFDRLGTVVATYEKLHLPEEEGFWETSHYEPGTEPAKPIDAFGVSIGLQICSDNNRPEGTHVLGASGAIAMINPRATEERTYQRWKLVFRANALTSSCYVMSVNRPHPEGGVLIGGPSVAVDPNGEPILETTDRIALVTLDAAVVREARVRYPGYLPVRARLYADAWAEVAGRDG